MTERARVWLPPLVLVVTVLAAAAGDRSPASLAIALTAGIGAAAVARLVFDRPAAAFGVLVALATASRLTVELPVGAMRLEQPAIVAAIVAIVASGRLARIRPPRAIVLAVVAVVGYLVVLGISSALIAPDPMASLRIVAWWAISLVAGIVAFVLVAPQARQAGAWLVAAGAVQGLVGIAVAVAFLVLGPAIHVGIQDVAAARPRVFGYAWESNLYASSLAALVPFAVELARTKPSSATFGALAVLAVAMPLGMTRGAWIALAVGLVVYAVVLGRRRATLGPALRRVVAVGVVAVAVGLTAPSVLLPNLLERAPSIETPTPPPPTGSGPIGASPSPRPPTTPRPTLAPDPDTIQFRLDRIPVALDDLDRSPVIGLGAASFGQRHADPSQGGAPDHLAILAIAAVYEAGIVGGALLAIAFVLLLGGLWRGSSDPVRAGACAAAIASIAALLVAYQATNALHFAFNWLIFGASAALLAAPAMGGGISEPTPADRPRSSPRRTLAS